MLAIYFGEAKGKTRLCSGAAVCAAVRDKNVLYVRFMPDADGQEKSPLSLARQITELKMPVLISVGEIETHKAQLSRLTREFFENAVRMALTFQYGMLILDDVFDVVGMGLLPEAEVYDFLSNAPDATEVICTGRQVEEKFLRLADNAVAMDIVGFYETEQRGGSDE